MKKSVIAALCAAAVAALGVPALSGCSAKVNYILKTGDDGSHYYSVVTGGFSNYLDGEYVIPDYYGEGSSRYPVKEIEAQAFYNTSITKLTIPATIEKIGNAAFAHCEQLKEVVFEEGISIDAIAWGSFAYCKGLKNISIPDSVTTVDGLSFYNCPKLTTVELPDGLERINYRAFYNCTALTDVTFPDNLITIGKEAFFSCTSLERVVLPDGMHDVAVEGSEDVIPAIGTIAFSMCSRLKLAVLGEGITTIESGVFGGCTSLETIYLPATLTKIKGNVADVYPHAFYATPSLVNVYFAGTEEEWQTVLSGIDDTVYGGVSDNSSVLNANKVFNTKYSG